MIFFLIILHKVYNPAFFFFYVSWTMNFIWLILYKFCFKDSIFNFETKKRFMITSVTYLSWSYKNLCFSVAKIQTIFLYFVCKVIILVYILCIIRMLINISFFHYLFFFFSFIHVLSWTIHRFFYILINSDFVITRKLSGVYFPILHGFFGVDYYACTEIMFGCDFWGGIFKKIIFL